MTAFSRVANEALLIVLAPGFSGKSTLTEAARASGHPDLVGDPDDAFDAAGRGLLDTLEAAGHLVAGELIRRQIIRPWLERLSAGGRTRIAFVHSPADLPLGGADGILYAPSAAVWTPDAAFRARSAGAPPLRVRRAEHQRRRLREYLADHPETPVFPHPADVLTAWRPVRQVVRDYH